MTQVIGERSPRLRAKLMQTGTTIQVAGSLNIPAYQWPFSAGITGCVLSPIALGLQQAGWRGFGRLRGLIAILTYIGPVWLLVAGLGCLFFAFAVRQAQRVRRRDLEITDAGFTLADRQGSRDFSDVDVLSLGFRPRSAPQGTVKIQKGTAALMVNGREGLERIELDWEYPDGLENPLQEWLDRLVARLHDRATASLDKGGWLAGDGWKLSRAGLQMGGEETEVTPFEEMALAEYHEGELRIWTRNQVEATIRIEEGSMNEAILYSIVNERMPARPDSSLVENSVGQGLGRLLFERRPTGSDKVALWLLCLILSGMFLGLALFATQKGAPVLIGVLAAIAVVVSLLPALSRQFSRFRFYEWGLSQSGLFGSRVLPFEDLAEVRTDLISHDSQLKVVFKPVRDRGRKKVTLYLKPTDAVLETIRAYIPAEIQLG